MKVVAAGGSGAGGSGAAGGSGGVGIKTDKIINKIVLTAAEQEVAAASGDVNAQFNLGLMYAKGTGVEQSLSKAKEWWTKAAAQGHESARKGIERLDSVSKKDTTVSSRENLRPAPAPPKDELDILQTVTRTKTAVDL